VFVTGADLTGTDDYGTVAYNPASGKQLWFAKFNGPGKQQDQANAIAVNPAGTRVYVTGWSASKKSGDGYATVAYNAASGKQVWARYYNGPGNNTDMAASVVVSPNGKDVFVTGSSDGTKSAADYATVGYNATTGKQLWVTRYNGPSSLGGSAFAAGVSTDSQTVYVTGQNWGKDSEDFATVAYNAATGAQRWVQRYNGKADGTDEAWSLAVSPAGNAIYVTGDSYQGLTSGYDYATIGYNAKTGKSLWTKVFKGSATFVDAPSAVVVSPNGKSVYVTGESNGGTKDGEDYGTVAYNAATGAQLWSKLYIGPNPGGGNQSNAIAVSPTGKSVYVTGQSYGAGTARDDYATVAYNAATGAQSWAQRYHGPSGSYDYAYGIAVSPSTGAVFVTGQSNGNYATIAYHG
jgi:DNA-binding beta-propeller fold protein YncE